MTCSCGVLEGLGSWPGETRDGGGWSDLRKSHSDSTSVPACYLTSPLITTFPVYTVTVQTRMQVSTQNVHAAKNMHMHTFSEQFFMEIDYVGQAVLLCTWQWHWHMVTEEIHFRTGLVQGLFRPRSFMEQISTQPTPEVVEGVMVLPVHMQFAYCWFDIGGLELNIFILYRQQLLAEHVIRFHLGVKKYKLIKPTSNSLTQCKCYISCFNSPNIMGTVAEKHIPHKWKVEETRDVPCVMSYFYIIHSKCMLSLHVHGSSSVSCVTPHTHES